MRRKPGAIVPIERSILETALHLHGLGATDFHGYQLAKQMREDEGARRLVAHGTLYKALDRLEAMGLLESRWEDPLEAAAEQRPRRRLYRVTAAGDLAASQSQPQPAQRLIVEPEAAQ
jgi:PadR family transcriptional regulator PadR